MQTTKRKSRLRVFHQLRLVGGWYQRFHCVRCERYFIRQPTAATCPGKFIDPLTRKERGGK